jgi:hypothetical protein
MRRLLAIVFEGDFARIQAKVFSTDCDIGQASACQLP